MKTVIIISQVFVGAVFIFSGFVKGVDPIGTAFRIEDYLLYYGMAWLIPLSLALSIFLSTVEFALGILLILNIKPAKTTWLLLLMMVFFTLLTLYDAIYEPVSDCGCFGDAIILTNWQTFFKNVVLMVPTLILFIHRNRVKSPIRPAGEWALIVGLPLLFAWFSVVNYRNLPMIDFLEWKVGSDISPERHLPVQFYLTYRNKATGEQKEYLSPNFPFNDPEWLAQWEFVSQRLVDPNPAPPHNLQILDQQHSDVTANYLENPDYQFILVIWDAQNIRTKPLQLMNDFYLQAEADGHSFIAVAPTLDEGKRLAAQLGLRYEFFFADDVELKVMVRSNPGLLLLHNGVVLGKWSHKNFPDYNELVNNLIHQQ